MSADQEAKMYSATEEAPSATSTANPSNPGLAVPPVNMHVYGELSILGYNGHIPNAERNGRRNKSKFLLCKRPTPNGIKKSRHYIVKQPQATKAIQDKDLHSISYTFSRSQTIIVEYKLDEDIDMFQIGRSSEEPIDFVVMDTVAPPPPPPPLEQPAHSSSGHVVTGNNLSRAPNQALDHGQGGSSRTSNYYHHMQSENIPGMSSANSNPVSNLMAGFGRFHATGAHHHMAAKVAHGAEEFLNCAPPLAHDPRNHHHQFNQQHRQHAQAMLLNYQASPPTNLSDLSPMMAEHSRYQQLLFEGHNNNNNNINHHMPTPSHIQRPHQHIQPQQPPHLMHSIHPISINQAHHHHHHHHHHLPPAHHHPHPNQHIHQHQQSSTDRPPICDNIVSTQSSYHHSSVERTQHANPSSSSKRSHATQSTISRFACRILIDRKPPYTARIYAAGFDSSKNIFLGEKATKWEQNNSIDGLTTNGVLLMHPKKGQFSEEPIKPVESTPTNTKKYECYDKSSDNNNQDNGDNINQEELSSSGLNLNEPKENISNHEACNKNEQPMNEASESICENQGNVEDTREKTNDTNNNSSNEHQDSNSDTGGVWREVSVDGGIYAIRDSRSAPQKGIRIENENNILQDGTLIDLCGATLLWRSVEGFRASPTKKSLEEKIDMLNATRPQCPVNLNTLVIPRKPLTNPHHKSPHKDNHRGPNRDKDKSQHQPYVYLKCGHVQGYHSWGTVDKTNHRTCPICLSIGSVAKLSMGLEPSFYVDSGPLTHVFNPCGHMASEKTVKYWTSVKIPHGTHFFHSICPFCATPLTTDEPAKTKLIFQDHLD